MKYIWTETMPAVAFQMIKTGTVGLLRFVKSLAEARATCVDGLSVIASLASWVISPFVAIEEFTSITELQLLSNLFRDSGHWMLRLYGTRICAIPGADILLLGYTLHYMKGNLIAVMGQATGDDKYGNSHYCFTVMHRIGLELRNFLYTLDPKSKIPKGTMLGITQVQPGHLITSTKICPPAEATFVEREVEQKLASVLGKFARKESILRLGQPRRMVILLHGPPGTGKTRLVSYLANIYCRHLVCYQVGKDLVRSLAYGLDDSQMPNGSALLIDELDKVFAKNTATATEALEETSKIAALSTFLDGTNTPDNVVIFLVANDISCIPPSIMRARRVHHIIHIDEFSSTLLAKAANYWTEGKMDIKAEELVPFHKKFVGAAVIQVLDDLDREEKLTKENYLHALETLLK